LNKIKSIEKIDGYWTNEDYVNLLELFGFSEAKTLSENELWDMLAMAVSDYEPKEAAEIVLTYKLGETLNSGQIENISHEMMEDKIAEEYPVIALHYPLFNINQLLHDCYNGKFPRTIGTSIEFELVFQGEVEVTKEIILRALSDLLSEKSLLKRLFQEQLDASAELKDAESIIWEVHTLGENQYRVISSDYWLNRDDIAKDECSGVLREEEIHHPEDED
jgi:hypothetical protein